jgi:hypothetical protein
MLFNCGFLSEMHEASGQVRDLWPMHRTCADTEPDAKATTMLEVTSFETVPNIGSRSSRNVAPA